MYKWVNDVYSMAWLSSCIDVVNAVEMYVMPKAHIDTDRTDV